MAAQSGELHVSHGVKYEEHHGIAAHLHFGQELAFCAGSEMRVVAGMESAFVVGAENKVGIATNSIFELGAEVKYVRGYAIEIAHEGGGAYENAFTASAGSSKPGAFRSLQCFMGLSVLAQVATVAGMLGNIKSNYVENGKLTPTGESGATVTLAICQNLAGVIMFLGTIVMNVVLRKWLHIEPLAVMTVNHESEAFIGVKGSLTHAGTAGLEFVPNQFRLTAGNKNRKFRTSGHEVVGYEADKPIAVDKTDPTTFIYGTDDFIKIQAKQLELSAISSPGGIAFNADRMRAWFGGNSAKPNASLILGKVSLVPGGGGQSQEVDGIRLATGGGSAVSMAENFARLSTNDGTMLEIVKGKHAKLSYANSGAQVLLEQNQAVLEFGRTNIKLSPQGVQIGGALTVLDPSPAIPSLMDKASVQKEIIEIYFNQLSVNVKRVAKQQADDVKSRVFAEIKNVKRTIETKISQALTKAGAV